MIKYDDIHRLTLLAKELHLMDVKVEPIGLGLRNGSRVAKFSTLSKRVSHDQMRTAQIADSLKELKLGDVIARSFKWGTLTQ